jgi:hypothetical protein
MAKANQPAKCPFYSDDIVTHCSSKEEAEQLLVKLSATMYEYELELRTEKAKILSCKNYQRNDTSENNSFTFLIYSFQPGPIMSSFGSMKRLVLFSAAIRQQAKHKNKAKRSIATRMEHSIIRMVCNEAEFYVARLAGVTGPRRGRR